MDEADLAGDHPYAVEHHDCLDSTNERATDLARRGDRDVAVVADEQTAGRGRRGREWVGPPGGVYVSVVVDPRLAPGEYPLVTLAAGVAVVRAVDSVTDLDARVKWPNDVLLDGRKLAGVLTERVDDALVVGVGVNANLDPDALPAGATSLRAARQEQDDGGRGDTGGADEGVDLAALTRALLEELSSLLADPDGVLPAWREAADTLGRRVCVETPGGDVVGEAVAVESPGALVVRTDDGDVQVTTGDCEHLRPAD